MDEVELIGGPEKVPIVIEPYDPRWPEVFDRHRRHIAEALGGAARRIDHIGSTSVEGLAAKPIVDIQVSVPDVDDESVYRDALIAVGYPLRVRESGHRMFRTPERDVHIHICTAGSDWERRHLLLRDWLRTSADDHLAYAELKRRLAQEDWPTMNHYADAKTDLITEMLARAQAWARSTNWSP